LELLQGEGLYARIWGEGGGGAGIVVGGTRMITRKKNVGGTGFCHKDETSSREG